MAESKQGRVSRLLNRLRGKKNKKAGQEELMKEFQETKSSIEDIEEVPINFSQSPKADSPKQIHDCDICMAENVFTVSLYLCYICGVYLCEKCLKMHDKTHEFVKRKNGEEERRGEAKEFVFGLRGESKVERGENLDRESVELIGRVNMKLDLDKRNCSITGLTGTENKRWIAVDIDNYCIKIFCSASNMLLQYIKFGSEPWDVTEITVQQTSVDPESCSRTDISVPARKEMDKQFLLAVTFPYKEQIWLIDVNKSPIVKTKTIQIDKTCTSIDLSQGNIFVLCSQGDHVESEWRYSIEILSTEGDQLKVIHTPGLSNQYIRHFVIYRRRIYLSDFYKNKVLCINIEDGNIISQLILEKSGPTGISVDHKNGVLYLCAGGLNKVYKFSPDFKEGEFEPLSLNSVNTQYPYRLCFVNDKLFISHTSSSLRMVVTVVQLLT